MLQGVVFDNNTKSVNTTFSPNKNLLNDAQLQLKDSQWKKKNQLKVDKNNGGVQLTLPHSLTKKYKECISKWMLKCSLLIRNIVLA